MDGYHGHEKGGQFVTYERLRAMGTNGFQEPATDFKDGKIVGTKRLFADGKFNSKDGKATFMETKWRGLRGGRQGSREGEMAVPDQQRPHQHQLAKYVSGPGRRVRDGSRPYPIIQMNPQDMADLKVKAGDLVKSTTTMGRRRRWSIRRRRRGGSRRSCSSPMRTACRQRGVAGVNEFIIPNYKQTWAAIRSSTDAPESARHLSFKSWEYSAG